MGAAPSIIKARTLATAQSASSPRSEPQKPSALSLLLAQDLDDDPLPEEPDAAVWACLFRDHLHAITAGERPLASLPYTPESASRAAHAFRAALYALRGEPSTEQAAGALAFGAEVVRVLPPEGRARILGSLDHAVLSESEQADIGLAALWQLAARALDLLCTPPLEPSLLSAATMVVFAFLADDSTSDDVRDTLPAIVERYSAPPLVVASLLSAAENAIESGAQPSDLTSPTTAKSSDSSTVRPGTAAAALAHAVSAVATSITPRAISSLAVTPRLSLSPSSVLGTNGLAAQKRAEERAHAHLRSASDALCLLATLVATDGAYRDAFLSLRDTAPDSTSPHAPFRVVYSALAFWASHPAAAMLTETLLSGNRKFRAYALSRTDAETLLMPLLQALYEQCTPANPATDAYSLTASLLILTSDRGFCEAIDAITIPAAKLSWADARGRFVHAPAPTLSAVVLYVGARVVQQSLLSKREPPETYTASLALSAMANVATATTTLHAPMADRLVSLLDFLSRRIRRAIMDADADISEPEAIHQPQNGALKSPRTRAKRELTANGVTEHVAAALREDATLVLGGKEKAAADTRDALIAHAGLALEIVAGVLRSRGDVSNNRHLVYALLHREHLVRRDGVLASLSLQCRALCTRLARVVRYFGAIVDPTTPTVGSESGHVLSVEHVFAVIDESARLMPPELLSGLPLLRFEYHNSSGEHRREFLATTAWDIVSRLSPLTARPETAEVQE